MARHLEENHVQERAPDTAQAQRQRKKKKETSMDALLLFLLKLMIVLAAGIALLIFVMGIYVAHSNDMFPALRDGDLCITWRLKESVYGDIISYNYDGVRRFGRVVGMPGDTIDIDGSGGYTVNGSIPNETIYYETQPDTSNPMPYPVTLGQGEVFVLNDFRENMADSRQFGPIPKSFNDGSVVILLRRRGW